MSRTSALIGLAASPGPPGLLAAGVLGSSLVLALAPGRSSAQRIALAVGSVSVVVAVGWGLLIVTGNVAQIL